MRVIYKYRWLRGEHLNVPRGKVVLVNYEGNGSELPTIWIEHESPTDSRMMRLYLYGTGGKIDAGHRHVGSAVCGRFVWHVYAGT